VSTSAWRTGPRGRGRGVRDELVFTTHTPVPAGHDRFVHGLAEHTSAALPSELGVPFDQLWQLATVDGDGLWSQTVLALRTRWRSNGVARLHGAVSRAMFASLYGVSDVADVPIGHVTNGVHPAPVGRAELAALYDWHLGAGAWDRRPAVWQAHPRRSTRPCCGDAHTVAPAPGCSRSARERLQRGRAHRGRPPDGRGLDPDALTLGFARRFATYKRGTLMLHDVDRLGAILGRRRPAGPAPGRREGPPA
jgi:glycogen phosphorylase